MSAPEALARYRTFWPRIVAGIVDAIVLLPLAFLLDPENYPVRGPLFDLALSAINSIIAILYSVLLHARYGQTVGKMVVGVTVMDASETRLPSFRQAFLRDIGEIAIDFSMLAYAVTLVFSGHYAAGDEYNSNFWTMLASAGLVWFFLEVVTMLTNSKRRAIHDFIAHTVVVRNA